MEQEPPVLALQPSLASMNDDELRAYEFRVTQPELLPDLVDRVRPADAPRPIVSGYYEERPGDGEVRSRISCAKCGRTNHWSGVVLLYPDGAKALVGHNCAEDHFGVDWDAIRHDFDQGVSRQHRLLEWDVAYLEFPELLEELVSLSENPAIVQRVATLNALRNALPVLDRRLQQVIGGRLTALREVRDYEAENRRERKLERDLDAMSAKAGMEREAYDRENADWIRSQRQPIWKAERHEIGRCDGWTFVGHANRIRDALATQRSTLANVYHRMRDHQSGQRLGDDVIRRTLAGAKDASQRLVEVLDQLRSADQFFSHDNLQRLVEWGGGPKASFAGATRSALLEGRSVWSLPALPPQPSWPRLTRFRGLFDLDRHDLRLRFSQECHAAGQASGAPSSQ